LNSSTVIPVNVAARIQRELCHRLAVAGKHGLERLDVLEFGPLRHRRWNALQE